MDPATKFLNSLSEDQKGKTLLPFDDQSKSKWHYLPAASWSRPGIQLHELEPAQKELLFNLLKASLSDTGYAKTKQIIELENVLAEISGNPNYRDPEKYHVAFYGDPQKNDLWAWSFEGHHISLNFTVADDKISIAPRFMGANPATILSGPKKGERTLHREEDLGLKLIGALSDPQKNKAIFQSSAPRDIVTANSSEVDPLKPVGIAMKELNKDQQLILNELIYEYLSTIPADLAKTRLEKLRTEEWSEIRFGWAGSITIGKPHYYRIQGKTFLIEFDNTQNNANHIHSVWRDFDGDFGRDLIREHYQHSHHH
jgi:hypothetical protein